jgi:hypothetical protein
MRGGGAVVWPEEAGEGERRPCPRPHVEAAMATHPVLAGPPRPFPCLLGPWQYVMASPAPNANTCFLDRTPATAKRVESSGEEERDQGDGCGAPWRSPHEAEFETAFAATNDVRCLKGASTTLPAQMSLSMSDSIVPTRVVDDSTAPPCPPAVVAAAL